MPPSVSINSELLQPLPFTNNPSELAHVLPLWIDHLNYSNNFGCIIKLTKFIMYAEVL